MCLCGPYFPAKGDQTFSDNTIPEDIISDDETLDAALLASGIDPNNFWLLPSNPKPLNQKD